jgi:hypothetical protein
MSITKIVKYINEEGFEFQFNPIEDSLKIKEIERELCSKCKTELQHINIGKENVFGCPNCKKEIQRKNAIKEKGYEARYIIQDNDVPDPFENDEGLGNFYHWKDYGKEQLEKYCEALGYDIDTHEKIGKENLDSVKIDKYEHSGISYSVSGEGIQCRWDTSHAWAVWLPNACLLEDLKRFKTAKTRRARCIELARQACETFNAWANGDVYCIVKETYNHKKEYIDHDICGGYFGSEYAEKALETDI